MEDVGIPVRVIGLPDWPLAASAVTGSQCGDGHHLHYALV
jgi:hypothetical protein